MARELPTPKPRSLILGIDPGIKGALVLLDPCHEWTGAPFVVGSFPMPTRKIPSRVMDKAARVRVCHDGLGDLIGRIQTWIKYAVIEEVGARPLQGVVSTFVFGHGTGIVHGCLGAFMIPFHLVRPEIWKIVTGTTADKASSMRVATKMFGEEAMKTHWPEKHMDGVAEAAIIAHFGMRFQHVKDPAAMPPTKGEFAKELLE